jgi:hypothetical protein
MGVSVTVVPFAPGPVIRSSPVATRSLGQDRFEVSSRLEIRSTTAYTVRIQSDSAISEGMLRANGRIARVTTSAGVDRAPQLVDLLVQLESVAARSQTVVAEVVAARLDQ